MENVKRRVPLPPSRELLIDKDVETAYNWFKNFIVPIDWKTERQKLKNT